MGSGKSLIVNKLSLQSNSQKKDIDFEISSKIGLSIPEIFEKKRENYFSRKQERIILQELLSLKKI